MKFDKDKSKNWIIIGLIGIMIILIGFLIVYFYAIPKLNNYITQKQVEAKDLVLITIVQQIQNQGYVQIGDAQGNKLTLVPYQAPKQ